MDKLMKVLQTALRAFFARWELLTGLRTKQYTIKSYEFSVNWPLVTFALFVIGAFVAFVTLPLVLAVLVTAVAVSLLLRRA